MGAAATRRLHSAAARDPAQERSQEDPAVKSPERGQDCESEDSLIFTGERSRLTHRYHDARFSHRALNMNKIFHSLTLFAVAVGGCKPPAPPSSSAPQSTAATRLLHPEELIIPPDMTGWPRALTVNGEFPHYPPTPRNKGVEARVVTAFVVDQTGHPETRTISILQSPSAHPEFVRSVCTFLRSSAEFSWGPQAPARALVVGSFNFTLTGVAVTEPLPVEPDLSAVRDKLRRLSPTELVAWIESKPHCFG